jgi:hypothetical protein
MTNYIWWVPYLIWDFSRCLGFAAAYKVMPSQLQESQLADAPFSFRGNSHSPNYDDECRVSTAYDEEGGEIDEVPLDGNDFNDISTPIGCDAIQQESYDSVVNNTQFVDVEYDTQATDSYDLAQTTQMVFQNIDQNPDEHSSATNPRKYIERPKPTVTDDVSDTFQFGPAPDPNTLKFRRQPPRKVFNFSEHINQDLSPPSGDAIKQGILKKPPMVVELTYHPIGYSGKGDSGTNLPSRGLTKTRKHSSSEKTKDAAEIPTLEGSTAKDRCIHIDSTLQENNQEVGIIQAQRQDKSPK